MVEINGKTAALLIAAVVIVSGIYGSTQYANGQNSTFGLSKNYVDKISPLVASANLSGDNPEIIAAANQCIADIEKLPPTDDKNVTRARTVILYGCRMMSNKNFADGYDEMMYGYSLLNNTTVHE